MKKECPFIFIPTGKLSKKGGICDTAYGFAIGGKDGIGMAHHLYVLSDEPNAGDYFISGFSIVKCAKREGLFAIDEKGNKYLAEKKIIATTNPELLGNYFSSDPQVCFNPPHRISQPDIEYIIDLYNSKSKSVDVEKLAEKMITDGKDFKAEGFSEYQNGKMNGIIDGYNKCLQDNTERKFTLEDIKNAWEDGRNYGYNDDCSSFEKYFFEDKEQPKNDTVIVEYEKIIDKPYMRTGMELSKSVSTQPKLKDGCILIVK